VWITATALALALGAGTARDAAAQSTATIRGTVSDSASRQPIDAAQVQVVGTTIGTLTGADGQFTLRNVPSGTVTVRVIRLGHAPTERRVAVGVGETVTADFAMARRAVELTDVVVVGYGSANRADVSNAVTTVKAEEIANAPVAGLDAALQGVAPGVQVIQNSGAPGTGITVRVRGSSSISASNQPLFVVDGVPIIREDYSQLDVGGADITGVTGINPDEIESMDILKDAAATAIYGSRGSNGVVLITTKRGRAGQSRATLDTYYGWQEASKRVDLLNGQEYIDYLIEGALLDGYTQADLPDLGFNFDPLAPAPTDTDWQDAVLRRAPIANVNLSLSGGSDRIQYYVSGSNFAQDGIVVGSSYKRQAARVNLDFNATEKLLFRTSVSLSREDHTRQENDNTIDGVVTNAIANPPWVPVRNSSGDYSTTDDGLEYTNSLALADLNEVDAKSLRALGNIEANFLASDKLRFTGRLGMDVMNLDEHRWDSPLVDGTYAAGANGVATKASASANRWLMEGFTTIEPWSVGTHRLTLVAGSAVEWNNVERDYMRGEGFGSTEFTNVGNAAQITDYDSYPSDNNLLSFFARANYTLADKYLFTASFRADGSSRFGENNRYGYFPSASFGWRLSDEPFMSGVGGIGDLKLRASYGETGNQDILDYARFGTFSKANYSGLPGLGRNRIANPDLRWETTRELDVGFDWYVFDGRIGLVGDYYRKKTDDLLLNRPITCTSGVCNWWTNVGNIENRGFELGLSTRNFVPEAAGDFEWTTELNLTWNHNEVTKLFQGEPFTSGIRGINRVEEGVPLGAFYTLRFDGVDPETGDAIYFDRDGDGEITSNDRMIVGSPHPTYFGGLRNNFRYRNFDLNTFLQFSHGAEIFNGIRVFADDGGYYWDNKYAIVKDSWKQPGDVTNEPRASYDGTSGARDVSSRFVEDGAYIRIGEITLGYRLPSRLSGALNLSEARFYVSGRNLKTFSDFIGYDPDVNSNGSGSNVSLGTEFYAYPRARTIMIGLSATR
jgi:TonB-linked SusC/RagA family outer membrane protein